MGSACQHRGPCGRSPLRGPPLPGMEQPGWGQLSWRAPRESVQAPESLQQTTQRLADPYSQSHWFPTQVTDGRASEIAARPAAVWERRRRAGSLLLCKALSLWICPVGKGFPSPGANLFYLLAAPNSHQICRLRSAPDSARTSTGVRLSVLLFAMDIKLIRNGKGKKDLPACRALTQSGWKGSGHE